MRRMILACALLTAACASPPARYAVTQRYVCADGDAFFARFASDAVVLDYGGGLSRTFAAAGGDAPPGSYARDGEVFRAFGPQAMLIRVGQPPVFCRRGEVRDMVLPSL
jgi:hypothetical protein